MDIHFESKWGLYIFLAIILFAPNLNEAVRATNVKESTNLDYLLPTSIVPLHYKLQILPILNPTPGFARFTAPGNIWIAVNCNEPTTALVLHAVNLNINSNAIEVRNLNTSSQETVLSTEYDEDRQFAIINIQNATIINNQYEIYIEFTNRISDTELYGMYLDSYEDPQTGQTHYIATTTFAAIQARRAFPCMDEPNLKATFDITIGRHRDYHSLSNAHLLTSEPILDIPSLQNWFWDQFAVTVPMSTYLVCMIVSNLAYVEANNTGDTRPIRVYGTPTLIGRGGGEYSANLTANVLVEFEQYYDVEYSLQKLDSVALPHFYFSAMENWGLITYTEDALLYLEDDMTESQRFRITNVVAHEVSHQFFGNYVTCKYWTWVWLNEGFATYVSHIGVEKTYPEFQPWEQFLVSVYQNALQHDSGRFTHPVENEPQTLAEVDSIYDRIAYDKGACLIRMMEGFLTEPVLLAGIRAYLKKMAFKGAEQDDLFEDLQLAVDASTITLDASVKEIMDSWTKQAGFPLLRVSTVSATELMILQQTFIGDGNVDPNATWWVPITIATDSSTTNHWMSTTESNKTIAMNTEQLIILNPDSIGYYRILYDSDLTDRIYSQLMKNHLALKSSTRIKILDDYFNLAINNYTSVRNVLKMTEYMDKEVELVAWKTVLKSYKNVTALLESKSEKLLHNNLIHAKIEAVLNTIGLEETNWDSFSTSVLRTTLIKEACTSGLNVCKEFSERLTTLWKSNPKKNPVPLDIQEVLSCTASIRYADDKTTPLTIRFNNYNLSAFNGEVIKDYSITCV